MKKNIYFLIIFSTLSYCSLAQKDSVRQVPFGISLYAEEDSFNSKFNEDRNYTGGGAITLTGCFTNTNWFIAPIFRKGIDRLIFIDKAFCRILKSKPYITSNSFAFGLTVFTPENIGTPCIIYGDRPYASMEFMASKQIRVWKKKDGYTDKLAVHTELNIGAIGWEVGDSLQTWIHRKKIRKHPNDTTNRPLPLGWINQLSRGGEATAMYKIIIQNRIRTIYWHNKQNQDNCFYKLAELSSAEEINIGYYTNASVGLTLKLGFFNSSFWQAGTNYGSAINGVVYKRKKKHNDDAAGNTGFSKDELRMDTYRNFEFYFIASARRKVVGYNVLLQGQFRDSNYEMPANQISRTIDEFELAAVLRLWRFNFIYEPIAGRTSEINTSFKRTHIWGAFHVSFNMPFL